jgi:hypothetical protein
LERTCNKFIQSGNIARCGKACYNHSIYQSARSKFCSVGDDSAFFKQEETFVKDVFRSTGFKLLVALIFVMFCLMLATSNTPNSLTANLFGSVATPMQRISTIVTNNAAAVTGSGKTKEQLEAENEQLRAEVDALRKKLVNYYTYQQENSQLRKFLELKNENPDFKPITAAVVGVTRTICSGSSPLTREHAAACRSMTLW